MNANYTHGLISILMPTYNVEKYVVQAVESILNQTYTQFELIIVDDASTDKTYDYLLECLDHVDIVLTYVEFFKQNTKEEILIHCCTEEIFDKLRHIIIAKYPDYIDAYDHYFDENKTSLFNMIFCKRELFDAYCEWLFSILFDLEKQVDLTNLNTYQQRLYGFLSERLLNVWVLKNCFTVRHLPIINVELSVYERIRLVRRRFTNRLRFWIKSEGKR